MVTPVKRKPRAKRVNRTKRVIEQSILDDFKAAFNTALDMRDVPAMHYGRQKWVHERYEVSISAARKWVSGKGLPDINNLVLISDDLGFSIDELLGRMPFEGITRKRKSLVLPIRNFDDAGSKGGKRSLLGKIEFDEGIISSALRMRHNGIELYPLSSDAMSDDINPGDVIAVDTVVDTLEDNKIYLFSADDRKLLRRVILNLDGTVKLLCSNKKYPEFTLKLSQIQIGSTPVRNAVLKLIGIVPWIIKQNANS